MPATMVMEKQFWSFFSTYAMNKFKFAMQQGWEDEVSCASCSVFVPEGSCQVPTGEGSCLRIAVTAVECAAE